MKWTRAGIVGGAALASWLLVACRSDAPSTSVPTPAPESATPSKPEDPAKTKEAVFDAGTHDGTPSPALNVAPTWKVRIAQPSAGRIAVIDSAHVAVAREGSLDVDVEIAQRSGLRRALRAAAHGAVEDEGVVQLIASPTQVIAAANGAIRVFDRNGKRIRELLPEESKRAVTGLVWLRDGSVLASMIDDRGGDDWRVVLRRWTADGAAGFVTEIKMVQRWSQGGISGAGLSPDGTSIATGVDQVDVIDSKTGDVAAPSFGYQKENENLTSLIADVTWRGDGPLACSSPSYIGTTTATIHLVRRDKPAVTFEAYAGPMEYAAFVGDRSGATIIM
jgi:WD40 repeat protein